MNNFKKQSYLFIAVLVGLCVSVSGCGKSKASDQIVASIGNVRLTVGDFVERIANLPAKYRDFVMKRKSEFLDEIVNDTLLYQEAVRKGLDKDKEVQKVMEEARKKILIARLLKDEVDKGIEVSEADIQQYYTDHEDKYMTPEVMRVSHILVPTREEAERLSAELAKGAAFEDLARARSMDPTAQRGGDIGYFPKGQLMPEFEAACQALEVGQVSGVVKTQLGYHLIKLTDRREPQLRPLDQVRENIRAELRTVKRQQIFNELVERLRQKTPVKVNEEALAKAVEEGTAAEVKK